MIYFDNAATTFPKPLAVKEALDEAMLRYGANPGRSGHELAAATARQVYQVREKAAAFFNAGDVEHVVFTQNCTYALNMAIKGLLRPGDHVVISDLEHNSVLRPVHALAARGIITYTVAETFPDAERTALSFCRAIRPNTRALVTTHASNVFGLKLPIERLGAVARQYGIYYIVDAAQTAGCEPIDIKRMNIDFLCMAGHKGLYGPSGTGMLITPCGESLTPLAEGGTGSVSMDYDQPDFMPDRLESGTLNTSGIIGLGAGIDFVEKCGIQAIASSEMQVLRTVYQGLSKLPDVILYTAFPEEQSQVAVLSFNLRDRSAEEVTELLSDKGFAVRGGLQCSPLAHKKYGTSAGGTVRISAGAFNTVEQGCALVRAVEEIVKEGPLPPAEKADASDSAPLVKLGGRTRKKD